MKYKTRLKLSLMLVIFLPILLVFMSFGMFGKSQLEIIERNYGISMNGYKNWFDTTAVMDKISKKAAKDIKQAIQDGKFEGDYVDYAATKNEELKKTFSYLVIYDEEKFTYIGIPESAATSVLVELPVIFEEEDFENLTFLVGEQDKYLVYPNYIRHKDGTTGIVYLLAETNRMLPEVRNYLFKFRIISVLVIALMICCLVIWGYKFFWKPMQKLKKAMKNIANGNLECKVEEQHEDEFGGLCHDFENMRIHLRDAVNTSIQYGQDTRELISNISHDLKTPLTTIKGYVEGIMDGVADTPEKMDKYLKTIYAKATDMERLIGELTLYSKIDTNDIPYNFIKLNVKEYFDDCVEDIRPELESRNFTLAYFNYVNTDVNIIADPEQLHRVINNIISNSIKYNNKDKGVINIRVREEKEYIHIEIEDNGQGVTPEEAGHIFERFYRTDTSRNSRTGGSGIGLSIVKKIIEAHGGTIWAVSNKNIGLIMHIMLKKE
ncbi:MAG: HAMP domain-containing sensor histidine kinase [Lachnospiraceae bacterium]|nr:HAMP domain-containing sensor histidine kinase [Lachnospiraceae bacterium]